MIKKIDHIGIAVKDLDKGLSKWQEILGLRLQGRDEIKERGVKLAELDIQGGPILELISPLGEDSPLRKFLDEKGEGIHHFCFEVDDVTDAMDKLKEAGVQFVNDQPLKGASDSLIAFIHPRIFNGVLIELKQKSK
jgi:methylmalonyl-CoA/ethylmalonyl-CoA epimerase